MLLLYTANSAIQYLSYLYLPTSHIHKTPITLGDDYKDSVGM